MRDIWLILHLIFLSVAVLGIYAADHQAFAWMRGKRPILGIHHLERSHWLVTIGLVGLVGSGLYLFWPEREYLLSQPLFLFKLLFVFALLLNSFFIESIMPLASQYQFATLPMSKKMQLLASGAVSSVSWASTVLVALLLFGWPF